jgi:HK97 gp10 family phage protein
MARQQDVSIEGLAELHRALKELPKQVARKLLRRATKDGATVIKIEAQRKLSGAAKTISVESLKAVQEKHVKTTSTFSVWNVGAIKDRFWLNILETGAKPHIIPGKRNGNTFQIKHPGFSARPWLRPAFDAHKAEALGVIAKELWRGIRVEAAKLNRGGR